MQLMSRYPNLYWDLAVDDPPYFNGPNKLGYYGAGWSSLGVKRDIYEKVGTWDIPGQEYFDMVRRKSRNQIIFGANYFDFIEQPYKTPRKGPEFDQWLEDHPTGWIVWDKCNDTSTFNDFELAWTSFDRPTVVFKFMWNGMLQGKSATEGHIMQGNKKLNEKRIHPTQKPTPLYKYIFTEYARSGQKILDNFLGSGSSAIAAHDYGLDFTGCEKDPIHYQKAMKRINTHRQQQMIKF